MKTDGDSLTTTSFLSLSKMAAPEAAPSSAHAHVHTHAHTQTTAYPQHFFFSPPRTPRAALWDNLGPWSRVFLVPSPQPSCLRPALLTEESVSTQPRSISHVIIFKPFIYSFSLVYLPSPQKIFGWSDFL